MRNIKKYRYLFAAVLTISVFVMGMLFSNLVDEARYSSLKSEIRQDNIDLESRQLQLNYLRSENVDSCKALKAGLRDIVSGYNKRLSNLQVYKENSFFKERQFESIKHSYILSGIRYWIFAQQMMEKCGSNINTILFFTTDIGSADKCEKCGKMGEQLTLLKRKYEDKLLIFTIPTQVEDGMIDMLEAQFNVTKMPTTVVNGNESKKIEGFESRKEIEKYLTIKED